MVKKSMNVLIGVNGTTQLSERKYKKKNHKTVDSPEKIQNCLSCNKPASQCKGTCYGK